MSNGEIVNINHKIQSYYTLFNDNFCGIHRNPSLEGNSFLKCYTQPPRSLRLEAIRKAWEKARSANPVSISTPSPTPEENKITDIEGNQYDVIKIGNQIWMKENLKVSKYRNGEDVPTGLDDNALYYTKKGAYAIHLNNNANNSIYGKEYNWFAVSDSRGLCPSGWHIPSDSEWTTLTNYLGGESVAGGKMKSTGTTLWSSPNTEATNESSFSVLPGGCRDGIMFTDGGEMAYFWSDTESGKSHAWIRELFYFDGGVERSGDVKSVGASVRCLRD